MTTVIDLFIELVGVPTTSEGWIVVYVFMLIMVLVLMIFFLSLPLLLLKR